MTTQQEKLKARVLKLMIKRGFNPKDAAEMVEKNFEIGIACCEDAKATWLIEFITTVD